MQYAVNECHDDPAALRNLLHEVAQEGGRVISVIWQPNRALMPDRAMKDSGYVIVSEHQ